MPDIRAQRIAAGKKLINRKATRNSTVIIEQVSLKSIKIGR